MQAELPTKTVNPRTEIQECWRVQASANIDDNTIRCVVDELVIEDTVDAMITELVAFEAVRQL